MFNVCQWKALDPDTFGRSQDPQKELSKEYNGTRLGGVKPEKYVLQAASWEQSFSDKLCGEKDKNWNVKVSLSLLMTPKVMSLKQKFSGHPKGWNFVAAY